MFLKLEMKIHEIPNVKGKEQYINKNSERMKNDKTRNY